MRILIPALAAAALLSPLSVSAQQSPGWFVPGGGGAAGGSRPGQPQQGQPQQGQPVQATRPASRPQPRPSAPPAVQVAPPPMGDPATGLSTAGAGQDTAPAPQVQLPPVPDLPPIPRGATPPAAVIGVLGIPDIMHGSTAAQQVEKTIGERREKLNQDAQKEQAAWRDLQQALANQRAGMTPDQIRGKERELQERITNSQRQFRDRNRYMQEAAQVGLAQIERMLIAVIRQVAESRGMNLVLHRAQVALNVNEFDITEPVIAQMNKIMPSVVLPPEGVSAVAAMQPATAPADAAPSAVPVTAPPGSTPPRR